ncbi:ion channel [Amaricoccus sp.]|uniref:ion channel n=1 Tax=Amaricoccus sp. TaxID=1872485 RepID=UPI001B79393D|nr:ion channel [Amaricoccus sp.]MBP7241112.1 hypothetical protein [Amaricoccus sp.]
MENLAQTGEQLAQTGEHLAQTGAQLAQASPVFEVGIGLLMLIATILVHGVGLRVVVRIFNHHWARVTSATRHWRSNLILAAAVGSLATLHMIETLLFALPLYWQGLFATLRDSYYYVLESYTTLGEGAVQLPQQWRLLGPIIAMAGLFTFGWTGSVLVSIMAQVGHIDRQQARRNAGADGPDGEGSGG